MVFPIVGGNQSTGYDISNSLRFNEDDKHYLERTFDSGGSRRTFTVSAWVKRSELGATNPVWGAAPSNGGQCSLQFNSSDQLVLREYNTTDEEVMNLVTSASFRDLSAWYHIVAAVDTTQSTSSNRAKLYVNGTLQSLGASSYPNQNYDLLMNSTTNTGKFFVGTETYSSVNVVFNGYMSEFYIINNSQLAPTSFGKTDDNGVWIPIDASGDLTFGANGLYLEFKQTGTSQNSSGIGADTSGEDHHFAINNNSAAFAATDITTDTPTNNFNTLNPLVPHHSIFDKETQGNTGLSSSGVQLRGGYMGSTIMPTSGKWYFEVNILSISGSSDRTGIAIPRFDSVTGDDHIEGGDYAGFTVSTGSIGRVFVTEGSSTTETDNSEYVFNGASVAIFAVDMDASTPRVYVGKNGTWFTTSAGSGGNPATNTGYFEANLSTGGSGFSVGARHSAGSSASQSMLYNFGQPAYTISSGNSDANGYGNFEYAVPSGYYAICTKNLAEFG